jgi:Tfp pilus assembly PilM family ATPase
MRTLYSRISKWFPIPRVMEIYYAGIHISSNNTVTYLEMKRKGEELIPVAFERVSFTRLNDEDNEDLVRVLTELHKKYKTYFIKATVPESKSYLFETEVPKSSDKDLREAVAFTIEEKAPVSLSEVIFGYRITDASLSDANIVSVGVVPEKVVQEYIDVYSRAGMRPVSMKVEAQAVANAVVDMDSPCNHIIVSIKDNKTVVAIVQNGGVFLSSTVDFAGTVFDTILEKHYPDAAPKDRIYTKYSQNFFVDTANEQLHMEFLEQASLLRNYLNKYYIYWLTHKATKEGDNERKLDSFIIVGDEVCIPGLLDYLNSQLKAKVEAGNVWRNCFDINKHVPEIPFESSFEYAETIGLLIGKD